MPTVVLITGTSSGLGQALAQRLTKNGYRVYGSSRNGASGNESFPTLRMDVCNNESVQQAVKSVLEKEGRIDVLVNNAGIGLASPIEALDADNLRKVFETNLIGAMQVCQAVLPAMRKQGSGKIINISSIGSQIGLPFRAGYSASKAALDLLTEGMRLEVGQFGVQACTVHAGDIRTPIANNRVMQEVKSDSPYFNMFEKAKKMMNEEVGKGMDADAVAAGVERIIAKKSISRAYTIGKPMQKIAPLAKRLLPVALFEKIIKGYAGI